MIQAVFKAPKEFSVLLPHGRVVAASVNQLQELLLVQLRRIEGHENAVIDWNQNVI